jgi:tetratricopeptide (TPR) repeat protein
LPQIPVHGQGRLGPDFVAVISAERTAGTAVAESIRAVFPKTQALHVHYLDGRARRPPPPDESEAQVQANKHAAEARVRLALADTSIERLIVAVERDPVDRIISSLWYVRGRRLSALYDAGKDVFADKAADLVKAMLDSQLARQREFALDVYQPLGLPPRPAPGRWRSREGASVWILDHSNLEVGFRHMTAEAFGYRIPLQRLNGAEQFGDARAYAAFRRYCRDLLPDIPQPPETPADAPPPRAEDAPAVALKRTAQAREDAGDVDGQIEAWRRVLALQADDLQALGRLSDLLAGQGRHAEAASHLRSMALVRPSLAKPWLKLAEGLMSAGDAPGELEARRQAMALGIDDAKQRSRIARLLIELGRDQEAREMLAASPSE